jgi:hypothetical protein
MVTYERGSTPAGSCWIIGEKSMKALKTNQLLMERSSDALWKDVGKDGRYAITF